jgi:hypothetical protein
VKGVLIGLGAGVTQKDPGERFGTELDQLLGQRFPSRMRHRARVEEELRGLLADSPDHVGMTVASGSDRVATIGVQPLVAVLVDQP